MTKKKLSKKAKKRRQENYHKAAWERWKGWETKSHATKTEVFRDGKWVDITEEQTKK